MTQFCYWEIYKDADFYILLSIGCLAFLILIYTLRYFFNIMRFFNKIDKKVFVIYLFCLFWAILYLTKIIFLLLEYSMVLKDQDETNMFRASQLFCVVDTLPTFFLMYLLILIPYFWLKNITKFLEKMKRSQAKERFILKFFTIYIYLRILIFGTLFPVQALLSDEPTVSSLCDIIIWIVLFQVFLSLCLLCYGLIKLFKNFKSLNVHDKQDRRKFRNEYLMMILCSLIRFGMDFYFILWDNTKGSNKTCFQYRADNYTYTILYIVFGQMLMHLTPIVTILSIYRIDFQVVMRSSLIQSQ